MKYAPTLFAVLIGGIGGVAGPLVAQRMLWCTVNTSAILRIASQGRECG